MIDKKMLQQLNEQITHEIYSAHLYLAMSAHFESTNLKGFATWMRIQYQEEIIHAMKIFDFINSRGEKAIIAQIGAPMTTWESPLEAFSDAYKHEQKVTALINALVDTAENLKDRATYSFLQWYVDEQVEEEEQTSDVVGKLRLIKDNPHALLMLDSELGARPPAVEATNQA